MIKYSYQAFGLKVSSEIELPELIPIEASTSYDLIIQIGKVTPLSLDNGKIINKPAFSKNRVEFLLKKPEVAYYKVSYGKTIIIEPFLHANFSTIRLFLLGTCLGIALQQRGVFCLHGSGIVNNHNNKAILFLGQSGAGKSTTCKYFVKHGYSYIGDDLIPIIKGNDGKIRAIPSYPHAKLWQNSLQKLNIPLSKTSGRIRPKFNKFGIKDITNFHTKPLEIEKCYVLNWSEQVPLFRTTRLDIAIATMVYSNQTYRNSKILFKEEKELFLNHCFSLAQSIPLIRIERDQNNDYLKEIIKLNL